MYGKLTAEHRYRVYSTRVPWDALRSRRVVGAVCRADFADACADNRVSAAPRLPQTITATSTPAASRIWNDPFLISARGYFTPLSATENILSTPQLFPHRRARLSDFVVLTHRASIFIHPLEKRARTAQRMTCALIYYITCIYTRSQRCRKIERETGVTPSPIGPCGIHYALNVLHFGRVCFTIDSRLGPNLDPVRSQHNMLMLYVTDTIRRRGGGFF